MPARDGNGPVGGARGRGRRHRRRRHRDADQDGQCVCPECDYEMSHHRGASCAHRTCPRCGAALTREV
ncbi:MAG: hypothetical protein DRI90_04925 [Deltaproteobacteria bacterium]|nr:MAG: hypothetical protein DRI90_04925 [Deltaproteobacteria bacterium]